VLVTVDEGRAVQFRGDPEHPVTRGFLCGKVNHYEQVVHSSDRLLYPLRRSGAKGSGSFERISWSDALAMIAERIGEVQQDPGPESIALYCYAGTMGLVHRHAPEALFNRLGATELVQNICYFGADAGYAAATGGGYGVDPEDAVHSDLLVVWGCNVVTTQVHLVPFLDQARKAGAQLWTIDPYRNRTAAKSDRWVAVRPGTDTALALGLMHILERDDRVDRDFVARRTTGYEHLRADVLPAYTPQRTAEITGVTEGVLLELADQLAAARAPFFKVGIGLGRSSHGAAGVRAICLLAGVLGAYEELGGGVQYDTGSEFRFNLDPVKRPDWRQKPARKLLMTDLGPALNEWNDPPIRFLYVHGSNPAATAPLQNRVRKGLAREDLFTVVHERFLTDTARYADLVLPAVTFAESGDLFKAYGHLHAQFSRPVLESRGECRTNLATIQALGRELGFTDAWMDESVESLALAILDASDHPNVAGIDRERLLSGEPVRLNLPRGRGSFHETFATPSGKLEFFSETLREKGLPAMPTYRGDPFNEAPEQYPLRLLTPPAHSFLNSSFGELESSRKRERSTPQLLVHPNDAGGIESGDSVELFNENGVVQLVARVSEDTQPGVVVAEGTWWPAHTPGGLGINALTSARLTDMGEGSTFHDNRVGMRKA
jgi:anaerobic selenocysteine-containing dehydrogenase